MATWDDVRRIIAALPETSERSPRDWRVRDKPLAWERPLRPKDLHELGDAAPRGAILGARVPDLGAKEALLSENPDVYFATSHFNGYPAILVVLAEIGVDDLEELLTEAWLNRAPKKMARDFLAAREAEER
jgi:hypothetical protein